MKLQVVKSYIIKDIQVDEITCLQNLISDRIYKIEKRLDGERKVLPGEKQQLNKELEILLSIGEGLDESPN